MPRALVSRLRRVLGILGLLIAVNAAAAARADIAYFVSKTTGGLYRFETSGTAITALTGTNTFPDASALALGSDGNLYVGDSTNGGSIRRYVMTSGSVSTVVTLSGSNPAFGSGPVSPAAIAFTPGGAMLVGRNPQAAFSGYPNGQILEVVGWNGSTPTVQNYSSGTGGNYQTGLTVAPDGTLYASNTTYDIFAAPLPALVGDVLKFDGSGVYQAVVAADGTATGGLSGPAGLGVFGSSLFIASTMNGNVYKTDLTNSNTATNTTLFASTGGDYLGPLAMLSDGGLLVGSVSGVPGLIYEFNTSGTLVGAFGDAAYGQIGGVVAVPEPATVLLFFAGAVGVTLSRLRGRRGA
ncbi:MAG: PEP-CTERM sorting domain-containing protein [Planctomycetia bacterium]|nr:PEP-CTERM sorting domain-containing protein [Planctomycetia bacterium]